MTLTPLASAAEPIPFHAVLAIAAFVLGIVQFVRLKGTRSHRAIGWLWVALMALVALSSFGIHTRCEVLGLSWIHLLSILTLAVLPLAVLAAHRHDVRRHRNAMVALFTGALVIAVGFTFVPGRVMHDVAFGTRTASPMCR